MSWVKLDDRFTEHKKVMGLTDKEFRVHVNALCYAGRMRDPHIHTSVLPAIRATKGTANNLTTKGLWDATSDGWVIHDWEEYQGPRSAAERQSDYRRRHQS